MRADRANPLFRTKIKSARELQKLLLKLKAKGKSIVFTNGCFDLLHYGHVKYLSDAKRKGDILVVGINTDTSVKSIKGEGRPITRQEDRAAIVAALESVDYATFFKEKTPLSIIKILKPDILVKGADWSNKSIVGADYVLSYGGKVSRIKLVKGRSTTNLIKKIAQSF